MPGASDPSFEPRIPGEVSLGQSPPENFLRKTFAQFHFLSSIRFFLTIILEEKTYMITLDVAGIASCVGANSDKCSLGPLSLKHSKIFHQLIRSHGIQLNWNRICYPDYRRTDCEMMHQLVQEISDWTRRTVARQKKFVTFGGDHSTAMGIWQGAMTALGPDRRLGLIWIDAHLDLHNFKTSPSGNLHGMPLAALLGRGDPQLAKIYGPGPHLHSENLALIGARSYEFEEQQVVEELNVHCSYGRATAEPRSLTEVLQEGVSIVTRNTDYYGISLDLDAIDPVSAPGVGTPVDGGFSGKELCRAFSSIFHDNRLLGVEIAEYYPGFDQNQRTLKLIAELVSTLFGISSTPNRFLGSSG